MLGEEDIQTATKLQERAFQVIKKNPDIPAYKALILAGYSERNALKNGTKILETKGFKDLQDIYKYEIIRHGVTPKVLAKTLKVGVKDKDAKTRLAYLQEVQKALNLSQDTPDVAVQVNIAKELEDYAT